MTTPLPDWFVYRGSLEPVRPERLQSWLDHPPPWRRPLPQEERQDGAQDERPDEELAARGASYVLEDVNVLKQVNAGLLLRRPLLVMGDPGIGKSLLAWSIAYRLGLGTPLVWPVNSRSKLEDALYRYEAIAHLQATQRESEHASPRADHRSPAAEEDAVGDARIGRFITLGPLGTAMVPGPRPRVLLIDEIDKASFDLPNDLLHVLEERRFVIPELLRVQARDVDVVTWDSRNGKRARVQVVEGSIRAGHFPVVVFTSNGDREFPPAFLRRCMCVRLHRPAPPVLAKIASMQLGRDVSEEEVVKALAEFQSVASIATDQVLSALFLLLSHQVPRSDSATVLDRTGGA